MIISIIAFLVNGENHCLKLDVHCYSETVRQVKRKIEQKLGILYENQRLLYQLVELKNWQLLKCCDVHEGEVLVMEEAGKSSSSFRVYLKNADGNIVKFIVEKNNTVYDLKEKLQAIEGTWSNRQRLTYEGLILEEEFKSLEECNISTGSEITMITI